MRKYLHHVFIAILTLCLSIPVVMNAAPRQRVILEHFTNTGCGYCAINNPTLDAAMNAMTRDTVIRISYHPWWPSPVDPFYTWNTSENAARTNFYGVASIGVPHGIVDGISTIAYYFNQSDIKSRVRSRYALTAPCSITLNAHTQGSTSIFYSGTITADEDITGKRLYVALISDLITYGSPPGSNGETSFPDPFRDMSPNANPGEAITASPGNPYAFSGTLNRSASWDANNLSVIAFVQNGSTREILQGELTDVINFEVVTPNGSEVWTYPEQHDLMWEAGLAGGNVMIELNRDYPGGVWEELFASTADDGVENWQVTGPTSSNCRIRISSITDPLITDESNADFTIQVPVITIVHPNGGEMLNGELSESIEWTSDALSGDVLIELNRDYPGGSWETVATVPNADTSLVLGIPVTLSARLRVTSVNETFATDDSDGDFEIFVYDLPPEIRHDPRGDAAAGSISFVAYLTDDRSLPQGTLYHREEGGGAFSSTSMTATGFTDEYSASPVLSDGAYEYFITVEDSASQLAQTDTLLMDAASCAGVLSWDDGTAEGFNWTNEIEFEWAVRVEPQGYPFALCGVRAAIARTVPGPTHSPIMVRVLDSDGSAGLPGTELWSEHSGSIGNEIGGLHPDSLYWATVYVEDNGGPLLLNAPFYLALSNPVNYKYEAFGRDDDTNNGNSFFFDGCELQWYNENDAVPNARGGARMIRALGFSMAAPSELVIQPAGVDVTLNWLPTGAPYYRIFSSDDPLGPFNTFEGFTSASAFTDSSTILVDEKKFYQVVGSATP